jgi:hypothetical protein
MSTMVSLDALNRRLKPIFVLTIGACPVQSILKDMLTETSLSDSSRVRAMSPQYFFRRSCVALKHSLIIGASCSCVFILFCLVILDAGFALVVRLVKGGWRSPLAANDTVILHCGKA